MSATLTTPRPGEIQALTEALGIDPDAVFSRLGQYHFPGIEQTALDAAAAGYDPMPSARAAAMVRMAAARDAALAAWIAASVTGITYLYSMARRSDYTAGLDRVERLDASAPVDAPNTIAYTVLDPATQTPLQVPHTAAQVNALLDVGQTVIESAWSTWHQRMAAISAATTVAEVEAVQWP